MILLGETNYRNDHRRFYIKNDDRRRHIYIVGKTGMGKSVLLENMAIQDIQAGNGVCVVDPHGDLAEHLLKFIPSHRINDVVYFNPADTAYPIAWNPMEHVSEGRRFLVASQLMRVFYKIWKDSWGPQLEHILRHTILAIMETKNSTLLAVQRMLVDEGFRQQITNKIDDPVIKQFWTKEFPENIKKRRDDPVSSTLNKIGQFLTVPLMRNIIGQPKSSFNLREIMDSQKILICNLSKGRIGEDNSELLGAMLITQLYLNAVERQDMPEHERKDFYAYIDEFQNFATESFENILSEARKYHLSLILANQYIEQLGDGVRAAVFGNCGTLISFRVGAEDAETLQKEIGTFNAEHFVNLPKYSIYIKLLIDGIAGNAFSAQTLAPCTEYQNQEEKVVRVSRERYNKSRKKVEEQLKRWPNL